MTATADTVPQHESKTLVFKYSYRYDLGYHIPDLYRGSIERVAGRPPPTAEEYRLRDEVNHWRTCFLRAASELYDLKQELKKYQS